MISTGNDTVNKMHELNITGNVIPQNWYRTIVKDNGKPYLQAIVILSDLVYWYKPIEIRDEQTGNIIGYKKKFKADKLQRTYNSLAEQFGLSKNDVINAVKFLEQIGVIKREFRTIKCGDVVCNNVLFIEVVPERIGDLTYKSMDSSPEILGYPLPTFWGEGGIKNRGTNTEITTKTSTVTTSKSSTLIKEKEIKEKELPFSEELNTAIEEWFAYKKEKKQTYTAIGKKQLLNRLKEMAGKHNETYVAEVIRYSMSQNWQGIYEPKLTENKNSTKQSLLPDDSWLPE